MFKFGERKQEWQQYFKHFYGKNILSMEIFLQRINSFGYLRLRSNDPFVYPSFNPKMLTNKRDYEDFVEILKFVFYFYEHSAIRPYLVPHKPIPGCQSCFDKPYYQCDSYIKCYITQFTYTGYHPSGSCRMGDPRRSDTVLDPRLRVKGLEKSSGVRRVNNASLG